jgi:hypothetical protein
VLRDLIERHTERRLRSPDLLARLRAEPTYAVPPAAPDPLDSPDPEDREAPMTAVESAP